MLRAVVRYRPAGTRRWLERPLGRSATTAGRASSRSPSSGRWQFTVEAWTDPTRPGSTSSTGSSPPARTSSRASSPRARRCSATASSPSWREAAPALGAKDRHGTASLAQPLEVDVERERARFGSWYELFPRSWGGFRGVAEVLPELAELGFDVVYLPPVHPIGTTNRKGRNNALVAEPGDPGSPWAIGGHEGGHDALAPGARHVGRVRRDGRGRARGRRRDLPRLRDPVLARPPVAAEHPEWFNRRPDGTLKYAENPPKRYQDIYNVNFGSEEWQSLWAALRDVVLGWCRRGVRIYRVDNPHTKSVPFWEWLIREVRSRVPGHDLPRRGVHAAGDDDDAREDRASASRTRTSPGRTRRPSSSSV